MCLTVVAAFMTLVPTRSTILWSGFCRRGGDKGAKEVSGGGTTTRQGCQRRSDFGSRGGGPSNPNPYTMECLEGCDGWLTRKRLVISFTQDGNVAEKRNVWISPPRASCRGSGASDGWLNKSAHAEKEQRVRTGKPGYRGASIYDRTCPASRIFSTSSTKPMLSISSTSSRTR